MPVTVDFPLVPGAQVRGARAGERQIGTLAVPERFFEGIEPGGRSGLGAVEVFRRQSVGDRLFIDSIVEDRPVSPGLFDGWKAQEVIDAAVESHRAGRWVAVGQGAAAAGS